MVERKVLRFQALTDAVLSWYAKYRRSLPWRAREGEPPDPYFVWLSEVLLQQTTVKTVLPYFDRLRIRWPTVQALAEADLDEIRTLWSGLGYYSRAERLHQTAQKLRGLKEWPATPAQWQNYPGIGPYTAAAISAIAFNFPVIPVDGNVVRVVQRVFSLSSTTRAELIRAVYAKTQAWQENSQAPWGDLAQGLMDLGATVCTPQQPKCKTCPLKRFCVFDPKAGSAVMSSKRRPIRLSYALCLINDQQELYVEQETTQKLLRGLMKVPMIDLVETPVVSCPCLQAVFSHFTWRTWIIRIDGVQGRPRLLTWEMLSETCESFPFADRLHTVFPYFLAGEWLSSEEIAARPQSALFRKILASLGFYLSSSTDELYSKS